MTIELTDAALYYGEEAHQVDAWQYLQSKTPELVLEEFAKFYRTPIENPSPNPLTVPYQSQNDNLSGTGYRECFSSSMAMCAMYWGRVSSDDEYNEIRNRYGDSTSTEAQMAALRSLDLEPRFITNASRQTIINEIDAGRPCGVGWLHKGTVDNPSGGGHWTVCIGWTSDSVVQHDPNGEANLIRGGYTSNLDGSSMYYSWNNWLPRWSLSSPNDGWLMQITPI